MSTSQINSFAKFSDNVHSEQVSPSSASSLRKHHILLTQELKPFIPESSYDIHNWLHKDWLLNTIDWSTSDVAGKVLYNWNIPQTISLGNTPLNQVLRRFLNVRFKIRLYVRFAGLQFFQGQLNLIWVPGMYADDRDGTSPMMPSITVWSSSGHHGVTCQANDTVSVSCLSTWASPTTHLNTKAYLNWLNKGDANTQTNIYESHFEFQQGVFVLLVRNRLQTGDANITSLPVHVWASIEELDLANPVFDETEFPATFHSYGKAQAGPTSSTPSGPITDGAGNQSQNVTVNVTSPSSSTPSSSGAAAGAAADKKKGGGGLFGDLLGKGLDTLQSFIKSPLSGDLMGGGAADAGALGIGGNGMLSSGLPFSEMVPESAALLALDRPRIVGCENTNIRSIASAPCFTKAPVHAHRLGITQTGCHLTPPVFSGQDTPNTNMWEIAKEPMLLWQINWPKSAVSNTILKQSLVNPLLSPVTPAYAETENTPFVQPTYCHFISKMFTYWRGGLNFDFEIVGTNYHNGILGITWVPGAENIDSALFVFDKNGDLGLKHSFCHNARFNLGEEANRSFRFNAFWALNQDYAVMHGPVLDQKTAVFPYTPAQTGAVYDANDKYFSGLLIIYVITPLSHTATVADNVDINIYISAGDDYHAAIPYVIDYRPPRYPGDGNTNETNPISLTAPTAFYDGKAEAETPAEQNDEHGEFQPMPATILGTTLSSQFESGTMHGDVISDIRDMARRQTMWCRQSLPLTSGIPPDLLVYPNYPGDSNRGFSSGDSPYGGYKTLLEYCSRIYMFWSGSIFTTLYTSASKNYALLVRAHHNPRVIDTTARPKWYTAVTGGTWQIQGVSGLSMDVFNIAEQTAITLQTPYFDNKPLRHTQRARADQGGANCQSGSTILEFNNSYADLKSIEISLFSGAADDLQFFHLVPPPPVSFDSDLDQGPDFSFGLF